jgi:phosphatidate cytidylyltransferase
VRVVWGQSSSGSLRWRVLVGLVFIPALLYLTHLGGIPFFLAVCLIFLLALWELFSMMRAAGIPLFVRTGLFVAGAILLWAFAQGSEGWPAVPLLLLIVVTTRGLAAPASADSFHRIAATTIAVLYVVWLGSHLILLRALPGPSADQAVAGRLYVYYAFILTWSYDTAAYGVGRVLGKRKLTPGISPHKTVEGLCGGLAAAVVASLIVTAVNPGYVTVVQAVEIGLLVGVTATLGDLFESFLKRAFGKKDSSNIIPGHGGVLDRFDSLLLSAPAIYYFLVLVVL